MRKLCSFVLCGLMMSTMLAGCGIGSSDSKVLKISALDGGYGKKGWQEVIKKFEDKENVKVELVIDDNIADKLESEFEAGDVPDLIYLSVGSDGGFTDSMIAKKEIEDISDVLEEDVYGEDVKVKDKLINGITNGFSTRPYDDGKLYLAPIHYGPCGLFYNATLFKEKGWKVPTTWDEMWNLAEQAKAEGIALFTYPTAGYFDAFFSSLLNEMVGPDAYTKMMSYDVATWESQDAKNAFDIIGKLAQYTEPSTMANANKENFKKNQQLILDNRAIFCPNGPWLPTEMKDAPKAAGFTWGFVALPKVSADADSYTAAFTEQVYIPKDAENKGLAKKFITYLYSDEATEIFYKNGKAVMPTQNASEFIPEDDKDKKMIYSVYDNGTKAVTVGFKAMKHSVEGVNVSDPNTGVLYGTINDVMNGSIRVDTWYQEVIDGVRKIADANR